MSYEIIKNIRIEGDKVIVKSASNNVYPRDYSEWTMNHRSENNTFTGKRGAEAEIMAGYEEGNFQGGSNRYNRAFRTLLNMPEYNKYNWRVGSRNRDIEYYKLLLKALDTKPSKERYLVYKVSYSGQKLYIRRINKYSISYTVTKDNAKKFLSKQEAEATNDYGIADYKVKEVTK